MNSGSSASVLPNIWITYFAPRWGKTDPSRLDDPVFDDAVHHRTSPGIEHFSSNTKPVPTAGNESRLIYRRKQWSLNQCIFYRIWAGVFYRISVKITHPQKSGSSKKHSVKNARSAQNLVLKHSKWMVSGVGFFTGSVKKQSWDFGSS